MRILAIDPGTTDSAFVRWHGGFIAEKGKVENPRILEILSNHFYDAVVIEQVACYGMAVGAEVFETVFWSGRFAQVAYSDDSRVVRIPRLAVKLHLCKDSKAKDGNIRAAIIDRYGGTSAIKKGAELHGFSGDIWAALAVGLTYLDGQTKVQP